MFSHTKNYVSAFLILLLSHGFLVADKRLIIRLQHAPAHILSEAERELLSFYTHEKSKQFGSLAPDYIARKTYDAEIQKSLMPVLSGFLAFYAGFLDYSDYTGNIEFPLRHKADACQLVIMSRVKPIILTGNTISHFEIDPNMLDNNGDKVVMYNYIKKVDDKNNTFWEVSRLPLPQDRKIPASAIILVTKPKNIGVRLGRFLHKETEHIVLPPLYVIGATEKDAAILNAQENSRFFEPIERSRSDKSDKIIQEMVVNY